MEIIVALMGLALVVAVAVYIAAPFTARPREIAAPEESSRDRLLAERNTVLTAIRDLDFDFQTGKLLEEDYRTVREKYAVRGVAILKELDTLPEPNRKPAVQPAGKERRPWMRSKRPCRRGEEPHRRPQVVRLRTTTSRRPFARAVNPRAAIRNPKSRRCSAQSVVNPLIR